MTVNIRLARPDDADALAALKLETFMESFVTGGFAIPYPPADLAMFLEQTYSVEAVQAELGDPEKTAWIAEENSRMLGYAHVGPTKLPHADARPGDAELYQIYIRSEAQGKRIGGRLLSLALAYLEQTRPGPIWLGVWSGNARAQAIYAALGFRKVGEYLFPVGDWRDQEYIFRHD